jgi:predicted Zn-dependent protease
MPGPSIEKLEHLLAQGNDTALLRFSLGNEYLKRNEPALAIGHLQRAVELQTDFSAAWKLLGRAQVEADRLEEAAETYRQGIRVAHSKGDKQAEREMQVFLRRLEKRLGNA